MRDAILDVLRALLYVRKGNINFYLNILKSLSSGQMSTSTTTTDQDLATAFRQHLPDLTSPRFTTCSKQSPYEYSEAFQQNHVPPWLYNLTEAWKSLLQEPYKGVSTDGMK